MSLFEIVITAILALVGSFISYVFWTTNQNTVEALRTLNKDYVSTKDSHQKQLTIQNGEILKHGLELMHHKEVQLRSEREIKELLVSTSNRFDQVLELAMNNTSKKRG